MQTQHTMINTSSTYENCARSLLKATSIQDHAIPLYSVPRITWLIDYRRIFNNFCSYKNAWRGLKHFFVGLHRPPRHPAEQDIVLVIAK